MKCEESTSGDFQISMSLVVNIDMSWEVTVLGSKLPSSCAILSSLPQIIGSMSHIKSILAYVDSCSVCIGNNDEKFHSLVTSRDGDFMDSSGMIWLLLVHYYKFTIREKSCSVL